MNNPMEARESHGGVLERFKPKAYYNEFDPKAAAWLRELIKEGHIPEGDVDERSIEDIVPTDLVGYTQCHFFAGIGGWAYALRLTGWPDDRPVWTGSCPCQPFSQAGKRKGASDERHLWPAFFHLIDFHRPDVVLGEQVSGASGRAWFDLVQADMEGVGYACWALDLCAASVGAPHIRQRLYWCADSQKEHGHAPCLLGESNYQRSSRAIRRFPCIGMDSEWEGENSRGKREPVLVRGYDGLPAMLAGFGNAIVPQQAAAFIVASGVM